VTEGLQTERRTCSCCLGNRGKKSNTVRERRRGVWPWKENVIGAGRGSEFAKKPTKKNRAETETSKRKAHADLSLILEEGRGRENGEKGEKRKRGGQEARKRSLSKKEQGMLKIPKKRAVEEQKKKKVRNHENRKSRHNQKGGR